MIVIGLIGAKASGKSTFAKIAKERFPTAVREGALADRLKQACSFALDIPREYFDLPHTKERYVGGSALGYRWGAPVMLTENTTAQFLDEFQLPLNDANVLPHVGKRFYTPRQIAQYVGTEVLRAVDPEVHCKGLMLTVGEMLPQPECLIVTDIRFPNELAFFMNKFGTQFYPTYVANAAAEVVAMHDGHASESHLYDLAASCRKIDNNGSLEDFETRVQNYMDGLMKGVER